MKIPDAVQKAFDKLSNAGQGKIIRELIEAVYANPPAPEKAPGLNREYGKWFPYYLAEKEKRAGRGGPTITIIPGAWYECSDGLVRQCDDDCKLGGRSVSLIVKECRLAVEVEGQPIYIIRRVYLSETPMPEIKPGPIEAVLTALDRGSLGIVGTHQKPWASVILHPKQIDGIRQLILLAQNRHDQPDDPSVSFSLKEAIEKFREATK